MKKKKTKKKALSVAEQKIVDDAAQYMAELLIRHIDNKGKNGQQRQ